MGNRNKTLTLVAMWCLLLFSASAGRGGSDEVKAGSDKTVSAEHPHYVLENDSVRVTIGSGSGGRIKSWFDKVAGCELVWWGGEKEIGGLLDDRQYFTLAAFETRERAETALGPVLELWASHPSGLAISKRFTLYADKPVLRVDYTYENGTLGVLAWWNRNFVVAGGGERGDRHRYFVPLAKGMLETAVANDFYGELAGSWAAMLDTEKKEGFAVICEARALEKFYFWQGSKIFPTFEWILKPLPAGHRMQVTVFLIQLNGVSKVSEEELRASLGELAQGVEMGPPEGTPRLEQIPGWVAEEERFQPTPEEEQRGFWLSEGKQSGKHRLPLPLWIDMGKEEGEAIYFGINPLRDLGTIPVKLEVVDAQIEALKEKVRFFVEEDYRLVAPEELTLAKGTDKRCWVIIEAKGLEPRLYSVTLGVGLGDERLELPLVLQVWDVNLPPRELLHIKPYTDVFTLIGGYDLNEAALRQADAMLPRFAQMGGTVLDWLAHWPAVLPHVKLKDTSEFLTEVAKKEPEQLDLNNLPELDFSYYDPLFERCQRLGITRFETSMDPLGSDAWSWRLLDPAVGAGRAKPGTPEGERVLVWVYSELLKYIRSKGYAEGWCKISDEISPEDMPSYIETAVVARKAGYRPYTTITGLIARSAGLTEQMDSYCDEWQLNTALKDDFLRNLKQPYRIMGEDFRLEGPWLPYSNGGAERTWATAFLGRQMEGDPTLVESLEVLENGELLTHRDSPWGNKDAGVWSDAGSGGLHIYVSARDGSDLNTNGKAYIVRLKMKVPAQEGEVLVHLDPTDEIWFYGGGSNPYRIPFEDSRALGWLGAAQEMKGFGFWAYYWWQESEKIVWYDEAKNEVTFGPAYLGIKEGWEEGLYYKALHERLGRRDDPRLENIIGPGQTASVRLGVRSLEAYQFVAVMNGDCPCAFREAKRKVLELLSEGAY